MRGCFFPLVQPCNIHLQLSETLTTQFNPPANGQAIVLLTGLLKVFVVYFWNITLATVSDNSVSHQAIQKYLTTKFSDIVVAWRRQWGWAGCLLSIMAALSPGKDLGSFGNGALFWSSGGMHGGLTNCSQIGQHLSKLTKMRSFSDQPKHLSKLTKIRRKKHLSKLTKMRRKKHLSN